MRHVGFLSWALFSCAAFAAPGDEKTAAAAHTGRLVIEPAAPGHLPWVVFDERSGLPQHTVVDLIEDQRGFVWAATQDGAARYDGRTFEAVPLPSRMGTNYPRVLRTAQDGGLWFGSFDGGLAHRQGDTWTIADTTSGLPSNRIRGLLETKDARGVVGLWIATEHGVARLSEGKLTTFGEGSGLPSLDAEGLGEMTGDDGERMLLVGTANGLARLEGDRFVAVHVPRQLLGHRIGDIVESAGLAGGPALWITSYGAGMGVLENGAWTVLDTASGLPSNVEVITKSQARDGSPALWIGTEGGLLRFEHRRFTIYDERCGLPTRNIWKVLETTSASGLATVWLGTWGGGVVRLAPNVWTVFDASTGLPGGAVTSVLATKDDAGAETIWAGTSDGELGRLENGRFARVELPKPLRHAIVFSLLETTDADGGRSLWVGSFGGGLGRRKAGRWTIVDPKLLPNERVYRLLETRGASGTSVLWVATEGGLGRLERGEWKFFRKGKELPSEIVKEVLETTRADGTRTIWAATSRGIARFEGGRWSVVGKEAGLQSQNVVSLELTTDAAGARWIWAGTFAGGASRVRLEDPGGRWETITTTTAPALPSDTVMSVAQDRQRRVYLFTTRGVARLAPRAPTPDDPAAFSVDLFTSEDGLPSGDCQPGARLVDTRGRLWVGTARGLAMFDPSQEAPDRTPKPLVIEAAAVSKRGRALQAGESLSHAERNLWFEYALLAYGAESRIRYRYQLAGFDPQPSEWSASATKEYTNLGSGPYAFQVWGKDARGNVSGPATLAFGIRPAPWRTGWAFGAYALTAAALAYAFVQWRVRVLERRTTELEAMVAERTTELAASRDKLEELASLDALTGVANRRRFDAALEHEWKRAQRGGHWLSLVLLDVDFFKRFNDRYGHVRGDACLRAVAEAVAAHGRRPGDVVARYGGEEFALVLPETEPAGVRTLLGAVLAGVDALQIEHADSDCASQVTVSLGAKSLKPGPGALSLTALESADRLLYEAKANGRHQALHEDESGARQRVGPGPVPPAPNGDPGLGVP